ncbi:MAG: S9 family peptidase [Acidobacteriota bacterium]|nr:S9 family peptidase [Acidobacteriota bacterium]
MKIKSIFAAALLFGAIPLVNINAQQKMNDVKPPVPAKKPKVTEINGVRLEDNYSWMRSDKDPKTGKVRPEVEEYLLAENAYTESVMKPYEALTNSLYDEMLGRIKQTDTNVPYRYGEYEYYTRTEEGKQYPIFARRKIGSNKEEITLDQNKLAEGYKFYSIGAYSISDDGNLLAFSSDNTGYRQYTLQIKDLRTGQILPDKIERVTSVVWANDNKTLFVGTEHEKTKRSDSFWRYTIGGKPELLYEEKDELYDVFANRSRDKKMILLTSFAKTMREVRYIPADQPNAELKVILPREKDHEYSVDFDEGKFYITTNKGAKNFRVVVAPMNDPSEKNWKEFIAHNPKVKIEDITFFADHGVVIERENGLEYLRIVDKKSGKSHRIDTPEPVYTMGLGANPEYNLKRIQYVYNSFVTPPSTFEYDLNTKERKLLKQMPVLGGYDAKQYEVQRVWVTARDGVKVPVAIVYKKGVKFDGSAPMLLYSYGSYGVSIPPTFSSARLSLLNRGMIYALASIRGGGELGEEWREQGRMFKKMNTFNDFIDVADYFVKNKYTSSERLVIQGGSAGGLLMGAVVNMRPDLFKASIAQVPFVDVMNTMLDEDLPLTTSEFIEWGNPKEKEAFEYMMKYSPYDNIKRQNYPNMLIEVSLNDSQVPYWEGAKFAAKIREMKTNDAQILLKTNMGAGHGGASGRYDALKETAFRYAYILSQVGLAK